MADERHQGRGQAQVQVRSELILVTVVEMFRERFGVHALDDDVLLRLTGRVLTDTLVLRHLLHSMRAPRSHRLNQAPIIVFGRIKIIERFGVSNNNMTF